MIFLFFFFFFFFLAVPSNCGILVPQQGFEPGRPAVEVWSLNH